MGNEEGNEDLKYTGTINTYAIGEGLINETSNNYSILKEIFSINTGNKGSIKLTDENAAYFNGNRYPFIIRELKFNIKEDSENEVKTKWNCFILKTSIIEKDVINTLFFHFYEKDYSNLRNNVLIFFLPDKGEEKRQNEIIINDAIKRLKEVSMESLPIIIIIGGQNGVNSETLKQINYLPSFNQTFLKIKENANQNITKDELLKLTYKAQINYLRTKIARIDFYYNQRGYNPNFINPLEMEMQTISINLNLALVGSSGTGKSSFINLNFDELVAKVSNSSDDVTTRCSEYLLPPKKNAIKIGQIKFLDFPGIKEEKYYLEIVKPQLIKKINEYKKKL